MNAKVFAALIRKKEHDYRKKTEKVCKISRALKEKYTRIIAISIKDINKALFKQDRRDPSVIARKFAKNFPKN
jgi:hypothetical protein